jgi:hypothetical protein
MSWTSPTDVTGAWIGADVPTSTPLIQTWIDKAEREVRRRVPDLQTRIAAEAALASPSTALLEDAIDVVVAMVTRKFRNPEQIRQRNVTTGPFTASKTYAGDAPGELEMTDSELAKLSAKVVHGAFTIDLLPSTSPFYVAP